MYITVAVCTWNRASLLDGALTEMHKLCIPAGVEWELLVVNNNCTDHTDEVLGRHQSHLPIRRLFEPKPGQSNARNCAAIAAEGELIISTDDDVRVSPEWLASYVEAARRWPSAMVFGGPVLPWFETEPPQWLHDVWNRVSSAYAIRDLGDDPIALDAERIPFGANYAVRREMLRRYTYDPNLGLKPNSHMRGEEVTLIRAMFADGFEGRWIPRAKVHHFVPRGRMTRGYLRNFFYGQGQFMARTQNHAAESKLFGKPRWLLRRAIELELRFQFARFFYSPQVWIEDLIAASTAWGQLSPPLAG